MQLLASQRLQQLFRESNDGSKTGSSPSQSIKHEQLLSTKSINGLRPILSPKPAKPVLTAGNLRATQLAVLYVLIRSVGKVLGVCVHLAML